MNKMNRRDYLKGMGAAAGVIAGTELNVLAQRPEQALAAATVTENKSQLLSSSDVTLVFHGLMGIWQDPQTGAWTVGFHSKASGAHEHQLMVTAYQKANTTPPCTQQGDTAPAKAIVLPGEPLLLEITNPRILDGVYFFQPPPTGGKKHDNDFSWIVNLESQDWYGPNHRPLAAVYDPRLIVTNGLFYTLMKTSSTFRRQQADGEDHRTIGNIAQYVAANIYLRPGGQVKLTLPKQPQPILLQQDPNASYEIHFMNTCFKKGTHTACDFKPYHPNKVMRSDFYMHFDGIHPQPAAELELVVGIGTQGTTAGICGEGSANDESPCSAVGFGGPNGFPVFP